MQPFPNFQSPGISWLARTAGKCWKTGQWALLSVPSVPLAGSHLASHTCVCLNSMSGHHFSSDYGSFILLSFLSSSSGGWAPGQQLVLLLKTGWGLFWIENSHKRCLIFFSDNSCSKHVKASGLPLNAFHSWFI